MKKILTISQILILTFFLVNIFSSDSFAKENLSKKEVEQIVDEKLATQEKKENWFVEHNFKPLLKTFLQYSFDLKASANQRRTAAKNDNAFDITRFYFGFDVDLTKHIMAEVQADINAKLAADTTDSDFDILLKFGFLKFGNFESVPGLEFIVGQAGLPWTGHVESIWEYRVQGPVLTDFERYLSTTDLGVGVKYAFPKKWGDLHFAVVNGTGFNGGPENDDYKDLHLRTTIRPFKNKNFFVSTLGVLGFNGTISNDHERLAGLIGYQDKEHGAIAAEVLYATDPPADLSARHPSLVGLARNAKALGFSGFGELKFFWWDEPWNRLSFVSRFDFLDPDWTTANNYHYRMISGLAYTLNKYFKFLADYDWSRYQAGAGQQGNNTLFLQIEAKL